MGGILLSVGAGDHRGTGAVVTGSLSSGISSIGAIAGRPFASNGIDNGIVGMSEPIAESGKGNASFSGVKCELLKAIGELDKASCVWQDPISEGFGELAGCNGVVGETWSCGNCELLIGIGWLFRAACVSHVPVAGDLGEPPANNGDVGWPRISRLLVGK